MKVPGKVSMTSQKQQTRKIRKTIQNSFEKSQKIFMKNTLKHEKHNKFTTFFL